MSCQCQGIEDEFNERVAARELKKYRRRGPRKTTRLLLGLVNEFADVSGASVLDIGGGIGTIQHELARSGARTISNVDASKSYISLAQTEAARLGLSDRITYRHGDFVEHASTVDAADIVTLDRVLCCYDNVDDLVRLSTARSLKLYGIVFPRTSWWTAVAFPLGNLLLKLKGSCFRAFLHSSDRVENLVRESGHRRLAERKTFWWQVVLYGR